MVEDILRMINDIDDMLWDIRTIACRYRSLELLDIMDKLQHALNQVFNKVAELKGKK